MRIPWWFITILTFPGIIVHELSHELFCGLFGVRVHKVCYFRLGNPAGYVIHDPPEKGSHRIFISVGPFLLNSIAGALIALPGTMAILHMHPWRRLDIILLWLGISIAMHAFPSTGDAKGVWKALWGRNSSILARLVAIPILPLIYLGAIGSMFWLDLIYGIAVAVILPMKLLKLL